MSMYSEHDPQYDFAKKPHIQITKAQSYLLNQGAAIEVYWHGGPLPVGQKVIAKTPSADTLNARVVKTEPGSDPSTTVLTLQWYGPKQPEGERRPTMEQHPRIKALTVKLIAQRLSNVDAYRMYAIAGPLGLEPSKAYVDKVLPECATLAQYIVQSVDDHLN